MERLRAKRIRIRQRLRNKFGRCDDELIETDDESENTTTPFDENSKPEKLSKNSKAEGRLSVLTILLVKAKNLPLDNDSREFADAQIKFRLGNEKYTSKSSWTKRWLEQFDFHIFNDNHNLEISLWNRNILYGKTNLDLSEYQSETTHSIRKSFEACPGEVLFMLTISGTTASETISDLNSYKEDPNKIKLLRERYRWQHCLENLRDVGHLTIKVYGATGLTAKDIVHRSDPFCVLELGNIRLQTQTERRTLMPTWNKIFTFNVKDISQCLEITVYDEHSDHRAKFLGKIVIPLLRIRNGVKHWYTLKNESLSAQAKGNSPQILLEMTVVWNEVRAVYRILQPKEEKLIKEEETKFQRQLFQRNVRRLRNILEDILETSRYMQSCFEWESPLRSVIAFILWIITCWYGSLEMIPLVLLFIILKNWSIRKSVPFSEHSYDFDDEDDDEKETEAKRSLRERLQRLQEVTRIVQNGIGHLASFGERIKNTFNFSAPFLSWLAALLFFIAFLVLHFVPLRLILLFVGLVKFIQPIIRPNKIPNNRLQYFLSRVPDDLEFNQYLDLPPKPTK